MALSKQASIIVLLIIDLVFFLVEAIAGIYSGSLALIADSLHMLNDVMSLIVALYAVKLAAKVETNSKYSYGWQRAEILGALINGVFLLALCLSIGLEAVQRLIEPPNISSPKLIVIVGSLGLLSNIVGLFLFHDHGHAHGFGHSHGHSHSEGAIALPESTEDAHQTHRHASSIPPPNIDDTTDLNPLLVAQQQNQEPSSRLPKAPTQSSLPDHAFSPQSGARRRQSDSINDVPTHPAATRAAVLQAAQLASIEYETDEDMSEDEGHHHASHPHPSHSRHASHGHPHGHQGSMNMHAVFLHVLGDALGNIGVIASGLVIWLTEWKYKYYFDPAASLALTGIIFASAMPLVRSASFILLQAVPEQIDLDSTRLAIESVPGVISSHECHIWQLNENKVVASVHVTLSDEQDLQRVTAGIRKIFHARGIHSSTIQPEYVNGRSSPASQCLEPCGPGECEQEQCCPPAHHELNV